MPCHLLTGAEKLLVVDAMQNNYLHKSSRVQKQQEIGKERRRVENYLLHAAKNNDSTWHCNYWNQFFFNSNEQLTLIKCIFNIIIIFLFIHQLCVYDWKELKPTINSYNDLFRGFPLITSLISSKSSVSYFSSASANLRCSTECVCRTCFARS